MTDIDLIIIIIIIIILIVVVVVTILVIVVVVIIIIIVTILVVSDVVSPQCRNGMICHQCQRHRFFSTCNHSKRLNAHSFLSCSFL